MTKIHTYEPSLEELYEIRETLIDELSACAFRTDINEDDEIRQKQYAISSQIKRHMYE